MIFDDISGHSREKELLRRALGAGRVAHAYLFSGPQGVGKRTLALAFAKALNCASTGVGYCGACRDCEAIEGGSHENVIELSPVDKDGAPSPGGTIKIDRVREAAAALRFSPRAGSRVVILDHAERLQPEAANAMLKTLEEPPAGAVIILVTSMARLLLSTIISRCQTLNFSPLGVDEVEGFLTSRKGVPPRDAALWARFSGGSIERALSCSDSGAMEKRREVIEGLARAFREGTVKTLDLAQSLSKEEDLDGILEFLKSWCRDMALLHEGMDRLVVDVDLAPLMKKGPPLRGVLSMYDRIEAARTSIAPPRYANKLLAMEVLLMDMAGAGLFA